VRSVEPVAADVARWHDLSVDVSPARNSDDAATLVQRALEAAAGASAGRLVAARVRLTGRGPVHVALVRDLAATEASVRAAAADVSGEVWVEKVVVRTLPEVDLAKARERKDALGHVARTVHDAVLDPETLKALAEELRPLLEKLPAGLGEDGRLFDAAEPGKVEAFLAEVEATLVPMLVEGEERP
jgi:hypothetical protein